MLNFSVNVDEVILFSFFLGCFMLWLWSNASKIIQPLVEQKAKGVFVVKLTFVLTAAIAGVIGYLAKLS